MHLTRLAYVFDIRDITERLQEVLSWIIQSNKVHQRKPPMGIEGLRRLWWRQTLCRIDKLNVSWPTRDETVFDQYLQAFTPPRHMHQLLESLQSRVWQRLVFPPACYGDTVVTHFHCPTRDHLVLHFQLS